VKPFDQDPFVKSIRLVRERIASFDGYPFAIPAIRQLHDLPIDPAVTIFMGENGSGKSTLLEAIAVALGFNPEGGSRNFNFSTRASHSVLHEFLAIDRGRNLRKPRDGYFFRAESLFNLATELERLDEGGRPETKLIRAYGKRYLHDQSHGESFFAFINNRLRGDGLYIFDEPEAALSPSRQLSVLAVMHRLVQQGSQLILGTHSPILAAYPGALIYMLDEQGIRTCEYVQTPTYRLYRDFINRPQRSLSVLLEPDGSLPEPGD
jgi:predicted ATPase